MLESQKKQTERHIFTSCGGGANLVLTSCEMILLSDPSDVVFILRFLHCSCFFQEYERTGVTHDPITSQGIGRVRNVGPLKAPKLRQRAAGCNLSGN